MPKPYPPEFRRDVVVVARKHEAPLNQLAKGLRHRGVLPGELAHEG
jgi:predicted deacylase